MTREWEPKAFKPRNIAVAGRELALAWGDGHESFYPFDGLREHCPCAACRSDAERVMRRSPPVALSIARLTPVGSYAVQVAWSDGHDTGIYAFETLRRACSCAECSSRPGAGWR